jgi:cyclomaltodextrinase / maltogenic alpha-amylase / neopullulanase
MTPQWTKDAIFYHIYPLGLLGAPDRNDFKQPETHRLSELGPWLAHIQSLGANAIYLGPVFQSTSHGYDTVDYFHVDRRLGSNEDLAQFVNDVHERGMHIIFDAVFNHVGRDFWAFQDLLSKGEGSTYRDWFHNIRFGERSPEGDDFNYEGWHGHTSLVKLNLANPDVRAHLFAAVRMWVEAFGVDGLRLDAADCIDLDFLQALRQFTQDIHDDFWLMGEVVHGDYRQWANPTTLHSVTNYECYKGLYSSLLESNYFEIAYGLNRQFGPDGIYKGIDLYNFVDNHDVDRVASKLSENALLYPLYLLLFTMPGIPSIYYGSEWGIEGIKGPWSDAALRPSLNLDKEGIQSSGSDLMNVIGQLSHIRNDSKVLRHGDYQQVFVSNQQFCFQRQYGEEVFLIILNSAPVVTELTIQLRFDEGIFVDVLNKGEPITFTKGQMSLTVPPRWGKVLQGNVT